MAAEKLSTEKIRELMKSWLKSTVWDVCRIHERWEKEETQKICDSFDVPNDKRTPEYAYHVVSEAWMNPKNWRRTSKTRESKAAIDVFDENEFIIDDSGEFNEALVKKCTSDEKYRSNCWVREFTPHDYFSDNYFMSVVTTPDDSEVVGWTIHVD